MFAGTVPMMALPDIRTGLRLLERYELEAPLASGGMGIVWKARHLHLGSPVAIKFALPGSGNSPNQLFQEARTGAGLGSPHIVQIFDVGEHAQTPFLVMELLKGETLDEKLRSFGRLSVPETLALASDLARGLNVAHQAGVIHRDLKPSNIFLVKNGGETLVKILDFGIARGQESLFADSERAGTPRYMSPEQVICGGTIDARVDLWALALVIYECLTGKSPHHGKTSEYILRTLGERALPRPSEAGFVSSEVDAWFRRATDPCLNNRFQDVQEMAHQLLAALSSAQDESIRSASRVKAESHTRRLNATAPTLAPGATKKVSFAKPKISKSQLRAVIGASVATATLIALSTLWTDITPSTTNVKHGEARPSPTIKGRLTKPKAPAQLLAETVQIMPSKPKPDLPASPKTAWVDMTESPSSVVLQSSPLRAPSADTQPPRAIQPTEIEEEDPSSVWNRRK